MPVLRVCKTCGFEFEYRLGKPGKINECWECAVEDVEKIAGIMAWEGKQTPVLILCSKKQAEQWKRTHSRRGASVMSGMIPHQTERAESDPKLHSGAEKGAIYRSNLGEKRSVK